MRLAALTASVGALAIVGYASGAVTVTADDLRAWVHGYGRLAPLAFVMLFFALNTMGVPAPALGAVSGGAFGMVVGTVVTLSAMCATACGQFLLARHLGGNALRQGVSGRMGRIGNFLERRGVLAVASGRLLPGPFSELNMAAGLSPLAFRDFAIGTLLGCAPKAAVWSAVGATLG